MVVNIKRRDTGIEQAVSHADNETPGWANLAGIMLLKYAKQINAAFLCEDFVVWAKTRMSAPPDARAWGGVIKKAAANKLIVKVGYDNCQYGSPKAKWELVG